MSCCPSLHSITKPLLISMHLHLNLFPSHTKTHLHLKMHTAPSFLMRPLLRTWRPVWSTGLPSSTDLLTPHGSCCFNTVVLYCWSCSVMLRFMCAFATAKTCWTVPGPQRANAWQTADGSTSCWSPSLQPLHFAGCHSPSSTWCQTGTRRLCPSATTTFCSPSATCWPCPLPASTPSSTASSTPTSGRRWERCSCTAAAARQRKSASVSPCPLCTWRCPVPLCLSRAGATLSLI